ncbi:MAG TPA: glycosyltransferase family A protein [Anaeromyxobacteraceae bacterium]|nr:glycosyltransferase family A protein [Anaeromyxobacteraceae bacterium]
MRAGIVVIGRNEGARLRRSLDAATATGAPLLYVDSGSTDGSPALARSLGVEVLPLDPARPFSAARARNEGIARLTALHPGLDAVQLVDGDCALDPDWLAGGLAALEGAPDVAVVAGRLRELHPEASVYNRLCALEWQRPAGEAKAVGGIFLVRAAPFRAAGGFRDDVVAAEEDELCLRLRRRGGRVLQLEEPMATHDAAMTRFSQWWRRARRTGQAYAQGADLHGGAAERHFVVDVRRILFWALLLPAAALLPAWPTRGLSLLLLLAYPLQLWRVYRAGRRRGWRPDEALPYAFFVMLAKLPGLLGLLEYRWRRLRGRAPALIEHKQAGSPS